MGLFFFRVVSYFKFLIKSGNAHGLHSPFVFDLYTKAIRPRKHDTVFDKIESQRRKFLKDHTLLKIRDAGAGSALMKAERKISDIARHSMSGRKKCQLLFRIVNHLKPATILELGTSLGISTAYLKEGNPNARLKSIEADPELATIANSHLKDNAEIINALFDDALPELLRDFHPELVYIDGNHRSEALLRYVEMILKNQTGEVTIVIDDIYWSQDMYSGWKKLIADERIGISIDLHHFGLLFTRKKQPKQHFSLRV